MLICSRWLLPRRRHSLSRLFCQLCVELQLVMEVPERQHAKWHTPNRVTVEIQSWRKLPVPASWCMARASLRASLPCGAHVYLRRLPEAHARASLYSWAAPKIG
jgi:hypothetical protein